MIGEIWSAEQCSTLLRFNHGHAIGRAKRGDDLGRKMMRQVAGAFMEYEKGRVVAKLRGARERKRTETGKKVGGRKSHAELWPEVVAEARRLRRAKGKAGRLSYREISARLKDAGYFNERSQPFNAQSVRAMIEGPQRRQRKTPS